MKSFFIDTTLCTACRACQVACKQWHNLPAEETVNRGSYQNPADLSFDTYKLVRMEEKMVSNRLQWLFFPEQCRHCIEPPCLDTAYDQKAIFKDPKTGAVIFTAETRNHDADAIRASCPYDIPRKASDGTIAKCDMCLDRVQNGLEPACVKTCPSGAMQFGDHEEILEMAKDRLSRVKKSYPQAAIIDPQYIQVIYLTAFDPDLYHKFACAPTGMQRGISRHVALKRLVKPFSAAAKELAG